MLDENDVIPMIIEDIQAMTAMDDPIVSWLIGVLGDTAAVLVVVYFFRDALLARLTRSIEFGFAKRLEEAKAEIRSNERRLENALESRAVELEKIQEFVGSLRKQRSAVVAAKRMEAAELALRRCNQIARLSMAVEIMQILKIEEVTRRKSEPTLKAFFETLAKGMRIDELLEEQSKQDQVLSSLYLSEAARSFIGAYEAIILQAVMFIKLMSIGMDPTRAMNLDLVREKVVELVPASEDGFNEHGIGYAYYWRQFFYDKALAALRDIANGNEQDQLDLSAAQELTVSVQLAQMEARKKLQDLGMPEDLVIPAEDIPDLIDE